MRILLINPVFSRYAGVQGHGGSSAPLNLAYVAAYLRVHEPGWTISILDAEALGLTYEETVAQATTFAPTLMGLTTTTPSFGTTVTLAERLCQALPDVPILAGGVHVTALPIESAGLPCFTAVVIGEGEVTALEAFRALANKEPLHAIPGLALRHPDTGEAFRTAPRELIAGLDEIPLPARDLLPMERYFSPPTKKVSTGQAANIISSRGCPYDCTYCMSSLIWHRRYRRRSVTSVLEEVESCIREYDCGEFNFNDDLFTADREWLRTFAAEVQSRQLPMRYVCNTRADRLDDETLQLLKTSGCAKVALGLESGSAEMLERMNKRLDLSAVPDVAERIKRAGIDLGAAFVIGHYGETETSIRQTIALAKRIRPHTVAFFQASPYPGTALYALLREKKLLREDADWAEYAIISDRPAPYDLPTLSGEEIHAWVKRAYRSFYLDPRYIWQRLRGIRSLSEIRSLLGGIGILWNVLTASRTSRGGDSTDQ